MGRGVGERTLPEVESPLLPGLGREDFPGFLVPEEPARLSGEGQEELVRFVEDGEALGRAIAEVENEDLFGLLQRLFLLLRQTVGAGAERIDDRRRVLVDGEVGYTDARLPGGLSFPFEVEIREAEEEPFQRGKRGLRRPGKVVQGQLKRGSVSPQGAGVTFD
ncbi:MAG: hypothetical protein IPN83_26340 [Holophagales bacterium]|nr:hypothetical protein [Holophagales bacterium]